MTQSNFEVVIPAAFSAAGVLVLDRQRFREAHERLGAAHPGRQAEVIVRIRQEQRTLDQNAGYWAFLREWIDREQTYDRAEDLHEALKLHLLGLEEPKPGQLPRVRSTAALSEQEFRDYAERCRVVRIRMHGW